MLLRSCTTKMKHLHTRWPFKVLRFHKLSGTKALNRSKHTRPLYTVELSKYTFAKQKHFAHPMHCACPSTPGLCMHFVQVHKVCVCTLLVQVHQVCVCISPVRVHQVCECTSPVKVHQVCVCTLLVTSTPELRMHLETKALRVSKYTRSVNVSLHPFPKRALRLSGYTRSVKRPTSFSEQSTSPVQVHEVCECTPTYFSEKGTSPVQVYRTYECTCKQRHFACPSTPGLRMSFPVQVHQVYE